jgi:fibronectin-binding autotransporter adhesin
VRHSWMFALSSVTVFLLAAPLPITYADINTTGQIFPYPWSPRSWTTSMDCTIGASDSGSVTVNSDSDLFSRNSAIGYESHEKTGTVTVTGLGSTWTNSGDLFVGCSGTGVLNLNDRGAVSCRSSTIGSTNFTTPGSGTVNVDGIGSTFTNSASLNVVTSGNGSLNITHGGSVLSSSCTVGHIEYQNYWKG